MIPRIIHYCWMNDSSLPQSFRKNLEGWKKLMPDYEFIMWNYDNFPRGKSHWVDQAFDAKKYAFCADYIRLYALYVMGGIYLDLDVEVIKPFDNLLHNEVLLGYEAIDNKYIGTGLIGSTPCAPWLSTAMSFYSHQDFKLDKNKFNIIPGPYIITDIITTHYPELVPLIRPFDFFTAKSLSTREILKTTDTYCIHHFAATWNPIYMRLKKHVKENLPVKFVKKLMRLKRYIIR